MRQLLLLIFVGLLQIAPPVSASESTLAAPADVSKYRAWVSEMKTLHRGPFQRLRWFCNDGTVFPPKPYPCKDRGGGHQHGQWSEKTLELREQGYLLATLLAGQDAEELADNPDFRNIYAQLLIERFLVSADDGWILRRALFYRGAIQEEDERAVARELLVELASRDQWIGPRFAALRVGVRMLPHGSNSASIQKVRQVSASLSDRDERFKPLLSLIHI